MVDPATVDQPSKIGEARLWPVSEVGCRGRVAERDPGVVDRRCVRLRRRIVADEDPMRVGSRRAVEVADEYDGDRLVGLACVRSRYVRESLAEQSRRFAAGVRADVVEVRVDDEEGGVAIDRPDSRPRRDPR